MPKSRRSRSASSSDNSDSDSNQNQNQNNNNNQKKKKTTAKAAAASSVDNSTSNKTRKAAFLFHRGLRLDDNLALRAALEKNIFSTVVPVFCVDPRQATPQQNRFFSPFALGVMRDALRDLQKQTDERLLLVTGEPHKVLPSLFQRQNITDVYSAEDYTPFARARSQALTESFASVNIAFHEVEDYLLHKPNTVLTGAGTPCKVFTHFYEQVKSKKVTEAVPLSSQLKAKLQRAPNLTAADLQNEKQAWKILNDNSKEAPAFSPGGRTEALRRLQALPVTHKNYDTSRDFLLTHPTLLSAFIKFGCVSIREVWHAMGKVAARNSATELRRQLIWREFFTHYFVAFPDELEWNRRATAYNSVALEVGENAIEKILHKDSHPLVKAAFTELSRTGYLHNRMRMQLAHWILHHQQEGNYKRGSPSLYWKDCDMIFARRLADYDPLINCGSWRGILRQPSFKRLQPKNQQQKFDARAPSDSFNPQQNSNQVPIGQTPAGFYTSFWNSNQQGGGNVSKEVVDHMHRRLQKVNVPQVAAAAAAAARR